MANSSHKYDKGHSFHTGFYACVLSYTPDSHLFEISWVYNLDLGPDENHVEEIIYNLYPELRTSTSYNSIISHTSDQAALVQAFNEG